MFISPDRLWDVQPWQNPYAYCSNNPINRVDPTGMLDWEPEGNGTLRAEKGDDAMTLSEQTGIPFNRANKIFGNLKNWDNGNSMESGITNVEGHTLQIPNIDNTLYCNKSDVSYNDLNFLQKGLVNFFSVFPTVLNFYFGDAPNDASDVEKLESALPGIATAGAFLFIGGIKVDKQSFHKNTKPKIKQYSGKFEKIVGKNPNINVDKVGNIILEGRGDFKGKTFKTDLKAIDYIK